MGIGKYTGKLEAEAVNDNLSRHEQLDVRFTEVGRELMAPMWLGNILPKLEEASAATLRHGRNPHTLADIAGAYLKVPNTRDYADLRESLRASIDETIGDKDIAAGYVNSMVYVDRLRSLALHIMESYKDVQHIVGTPEAIEKCRKEVVQGLREVGGVGEKQAEHLTRTYMDAVHDLAKEVLGKGR